MICRLLCLWLLVCLFEAPVYSQQITQHIRGVVREAVSGTPIAYADIAVIGTDPLVGTTSDLDGKFLIPDLPVGRYDIRCSYLGFEPVILTEILVTSSREVELQIELFQSSLQLEEVVVKPRIVKSQPLNEMATVSSRMFSVEEASRYAGGFDDPARLASSFAGVSSSVGTNGIVIRGNAPRLLQWRMEGVPIPSPNHFANLTTFGGGGLTALSSHVMANSDFYTGAFPALFHNALSGVFDASMRNGTSHSYRTSVQMGLIGIDLASEGPFRHGKRSSYLLNYRYSTLGLLQSLLPEDADGTSYQDLSFKLHFPIGTKINLNVWGIGLSDRSGQEASLDTLLWEYEQDRESGSPKQYMAAVGVRFSYFPDRRIRMETSLALTGEGLDWRVDRLNPSLLLVPHEQIRQQDINMIWTSNFRTNVGDLLTLQAGWTLTGMKYDLFLESYQTDESKPELIIDQDGFSTVGSIYLNTSWRLMDRIVLQAGFTGQMFTLNDSYALEPRLGIKWQLQRKSSLSFGFGLHSHLEQLRYYFSRRPDDSTPPNKDLDFSRARHWVLGWDKQLGDQHLFRIEGYFQYLYDIPVIPGTSFSFVNLQNEWFIGEDLINEGEGRNYGLDLTLERYLSDGYYYMITGSVFRSQYAGGDLIWRNSAFDRRFVLNVLGGKEWQLRGKFPRFLGLNARFTIQGGDPYSPVNTEESLLQSMVIYRDDLAYSLRQQPIPVLHLTASLRIDRPKSSHELALKVLNLTGQSDFLGHRYNYLHKRIDPYREAIIIPNLSYKIAW